MIKVPVSTVEKPLTAIDYIAAMQECRTSLEVGQFADQVPMSIRCDERFARAVIERLNDIKERRRKQA